MRQHKFKIGELVHLFPRALSPVRPSDRASPRESYQVTRLLPESGADLQYRIKSATKGQERVVAESEIGAAAER